MVKTPEILQTQLGEAFKTVVDNDHPEKWPGLTNELKANVMTSELSRMHGGLYGLRLLARKYEFKDGDERQPLEHMANECMPMLLELINKLNADNSDNPDVGQLMKLACKTFWSSTYLQLPSHLWNPETLHSWLAAFHQLLIRPIPTQNQPEDLDERK